MKALFESKIFASLDIERQNKIRAALASPINVELVQQLSSYLDEQPESAESEIKHEEEPDEHDIDVVTDEPEEDTDDNQPAAEPSSTEKLYKIDTLDKHLEDKLEPVEPEVNPEELAEENPFVEDKIEESTSINAAAIVDTCTNIIPDIETIKGTLNAREDTAGVTQIRVKDSELWVYYQDNLNLNNIMPNTIDVLARTDSYLEFNRLARSNNAIVFDIIAAQTPVQLDEKDEEK